MDKALMRLERVHVTLRYLQVWWDFMSEEEKRVHVGRAFEDIGNARQIADYWRDYATRNGVALPPKPGEGDEHE